MTQSADYGEARQRWPAVNADFGSFDLAGFEKGGAWWYRAWWRDAVAAQDPLADGSHAPPVCRIWNDRWDGELVTKDGQIQINVVTAAPAAELFVDGASQGFQTISNPTHPASNNHHNGGTAHWAVVISPDPVLLPLSVPDARAPWPPSPPSPPSPAQGVQPGSNLTLVCKSSNSSDGETIGAHTIIAPGPPAAIRLSIDAPNISKGTGSALLLDGQDVARPSPFFVLG